MPAIQVADLNNAKTDVDHIAAVATSTAPTVVDRLGGVKKTMAGITAEMNAQVAAVTAARNTAVNVNIPAAEDAVYLRANTAMLTNIPNAEAAVNAVANTAMLTTIPAAVAEVDEAVAATYVGQAAASSASAAAADVSAEAARDVALATSRCYVSTAAGLAATSSGQVFAVSTSDPQVVNLYSNTAGVAVSIGSLNIANGNLIEETYSALAWAVRDQFGNAALGVESDGTVVAHSMRVTNLEGSMINTRRYALVTDTDYAGGADPTGVANADAAFAAALASGWNTIVIPDDSIFLLATALTLSDGMEIRGEGWGAVLRWTTNGRLITLGNRSRARDLKILGDGKASGKTLQTGLYASAKTGWQISDVNFEDLGGAHASTGGAIVVTNNVGTDREGGTIRGVRLKSNASGIVLVARGEYVGISEVDGFGNDTAIYTDSGNFRMGGLNLGNNGVAIEVATGTNDSHGTISHSQVNHNTTNLKVGAITQGLQLIGSHFYSGNIDIAGAAGVDFVGSHLCSGTITLTGTCSVAVRGGRFPQSPDSDAMTQTLNGNTIVQTATPFNF